MKISDQAIDKTLIASRYNFYVPTAGYVLVYNSNTGAVLKLSGIDAFEFAKLISGSTIEVSLSDLPADLADQLIEGGFLLPSGTDELLGIRERFHEARGNTPLVLTLTTTMDCNLGCFYCYEERSKERLVAADVTAIVESTRRRLREHPRKSLHVDWYGGEPLLNIQFLEECSFALQKMCSHEGISFHASVISNGTLWPNEVGTFVSQHRIRQVQVSFDGMRENHNKRRRFSALSQPAFKQSSFDLVVDLVDRLLDHTRVDLRFNADRYNQNDLLPFVKFAEDRGWFNRQFLAVIQPARLAAFSDRAAFLRPTEMTIPEYDRLRQSLRDHANTKITLEESETPDGFPYPKTSVCAALASQSEVIGADGLKYRCGLQVGEKHRAVGSIRSASTEQTFADSEWWESFDPTSLPSCSRCSFLPVCWGGCAKKHLDMDQHALDEQSIFWRTNLPRLIASHFNMMPDPGFTYNEDDQFR